MSLLPLSFIDQWMAQGAKEHYLDPALYDEEYKNRKSDVRFYIKWAQSLVQNNDSSILELGCGTGRLLIPLLQKGYKVTGLDQSRPMLDYLRAKHAQRKRPQHAHAPLHLVQSHLLNLTQALPNKKRFSLVLCPFHTLMHLHKRQDILSLLSQIHTVLEKGGHFIFDVIMPDIQWLNRHPAKRWSKSYLVHPITKERFCYTTNHLYDPVSQVVLIHMFYQPIDDKKNPIPEKPEKVITLAQRQFFPEELLHLVESSGFRVKHRFGHFDELPLHQNSEQQIFILQKQ